MFVYVFLTLYIVFNTLFRLILCPIWFWYIAMCGVIKLKGNQVQVLNSPAAVSRAIFLLSKRNRHWFLLQRIVTACIITK